MARLLLLVPLIFSYLHAYASTTKLDGLTVFVRNFVETWAVLIGIDIYISQQTEIQQCEAIQQLSILKIALQEEESPVMRQIFAFLFPFGPAWNSILGTFYISSYAPSFSRVCTNRVLIHTCYFILAGCRVPNFILAFIPAEINANTLNTMTAFAVSLITHLG